MAKIQDIENTVKEESKLLTITEDSTATEASQIMSENKIGCLVVLDKDGKFSGILSERDLLGQTLAKSLSADDVVVKDIMTSNVISCTRDTDVGKAERLMDEHRIRHLPIVEDGKAVGMISSRDIIAYLIRSNRAMKAAAEQLQVLSVRLKGLDTKDLYNTMLNEVPESFEADSAIICLSEGDSSKLNVYRKGCTVSERELDGPEEIIQLSQNGWIICGEICEACQKVGGYAPRVVIPLHISKQYCDNENGQVELKGFLCMCQLNQHATQSKELQLHKASLIQEILGLHITNATLYENYQKAKEDSLIDPLTDVSTRVLLDKMLKIEHARAVRYKRSFSIALIDVNSLNQINDSAGHETGDIVLKEIGKIISDNMRNVDVIGRFAEDKFVLLMPETPMDGAEILLGRLHEQIGDISVAKVESVSVSSGLSEWSGSGDDTMENILERARAALHEAKETGNNCLVTSPTPASTA